MTSAVLGHSPTNLSEKNAINTQKLYIMLLSREKYLSSCHSRPPLSAACAPLPTKLSRR